MATLKPAQEKRYVITCKIIHKESGLGLSDLLVVLQNVSKEQKEATTSSSKPDHSKVYQSGERIGSALTDQNGEVSFEGEEINQKTLKEKNLSLFVLLPEEPDLSLEERIIYFSKDVRLNAGSKEVYLIKFKTEFLNSKKIDIPASFSAKDDPIAKLEKEIQTTKDIADRKRNLLKEKVVKNNKAYNEEKETGFTAPFMDLISKVDKDFREGNQFAKPGDSIHKITFDNIGSELGDILNPAPEEDHKKRVKGHIYLSQEEKDKYKQYLSEDGTEYNLPDKVIEEDILPKLFHKADSGSSNDFFMDHPGVRKCRSKEKEEDQQQDPDTPHAENPEMTPATVEDIPVYVAHQMNTATSPEEQLAVGLEIMSLEKRPTNDDITNSVAGTVFQKGPADVPAYYEFHSLKIAFRNIWQEAFDLGLIERGKRWYDEIVANGGDAKLKDTDIFPGTLGITDIIGKIGDTIFNGFDYVHDLYAGDDNRNPSVTVHDHRNESKHGFTPEVALEFPEAIPIWSKLTNIERNVLIKIAELLTDAFSGYFNENADESKKPDWITTYMNQSNNLAVLRAKGKSIIDAANERIDEKKEVVDEYSSLKRAKQLTNDLLKDLHSKYSFRHFAANGNERSVNFGILLSYQQKWEPLNYQAGELVKTIPLAPKETRKFSKKINVKKHRTEKEQEENLRITKSESQDTSRAESEIVNKAGNKTAFDKNNTTSGGVSEGPLTSSNSSSFTLHNESERDSQQTKKNFHEAVVKASQEYKNERKIEIITEETYESEITESGEISNPNDELTVTYLFYELQRQFKISERLYRLRPVIMVAQEMPSPHQITNEWVITHDWIIRRVLLDDSFKQGLEYIYIINGEQLLMDELERTVREQRSIVKDLRQNVRFLTEEVAVQNALMMRAIDRQAGILDERTVWDRVPVVGKALDITENVLDGVGNLIGMGGDNEESANEAARIRTESMTAAYERSERERKELLARLESETTVLNDLSKQLALKRKDIIEKQTHIARLKAHIKDNILYYMQSIWNYEPRDQRFFRLFNTKVPVFDGKYSIIIKAAPAERTISDLAVEDKTRHVYHMEVKMEMKHATLKEVADLDDMLGYKGNYMIFSLNRSNILTDFMMAPYIDSEFGLTDPDNLGNWSLEDFDKFVACLQKEMTAEDYKKIEDDIKKFYKQLLMDPLRNGDLITVPTGSLFIEALPGSHTILEYFKLAHRFEDVKKVQAENRWAELNNARLAARIITGDYEEPKIDKKIVVEGNEVSTHLDMDS